MVLDVHGGDLRATPFELKRHGPVPGSDLEGTRAAQVFIDTEMVEMLSRPGHLPPWRDKPGQKLEGMKPLGHASNHFSSQGKVCDHSRVLDDGIRFGTAIISAQGSS